ncbi:MAG: methylated-DNA--[protein]-cysteine S-methyltransferase [Phycisphaerales bacterium]|nr:methylated-DNA--[protein]-cysteine S-methyltransferase [Planctomycetota bacterium]MBL6997542.1 methylated-DNA--[protein]-cysteine S-methyltransferase [Phycisphaerales bacterium]
MIIETKVGPISLGYFDGELFCDFGRHVSEKEPTKKLAQQFADYFDGKLVEKFDAPIPDSTPFTQKCWVACRAIPYGETITYAELAKHAGSPKAMRAAGQAMRKNPLTLITPCHRVISGTGHLHGYSGSTDLEGMELKRKQYLLDLEKGIMKS